MGIVIQSHAPCVQVRATDGEVTDRLMLQDDFVHLSHNAGVAACGGRLAVMCLRSQTIRLLQVCSQRGAPSSSSQTADRVYELAVMKPSSFNFRLWHGRLSVF